MERPDHGPRKEALRRSLEAAAEAGKLKLLVIEDNPSGVTSLEVAVRRALPGWVVLAALDGTSGIELAVGQDPDVVLLDMELPGPGGVAVCRRLKAHERLRDTPILLATGLAGGRETRLEGLRAGAEGFLSRPLDDVELVAQIQVMTKLKAAVRQAEEALRESEERYRQLFEAESDAILLIENGTNRILEANGAAAAMYGYSREELLAKKNTDLSAEPEQTDRVTRSTPLGRENVVTVPLRFHRRRNGTTFPVEITGRFFEWQGRGVHIAAIRDITERKQAEDALRESEERFRLISRLSPAGICLTDPDGECLFVNDHWCRMAGLGRDEALGTEWTRSIHPEDRQGVLDSWTKIAATRGKWGAEYRLQDGAGNTTWVYGVAAPLEDADGRVTGYVGVTVDTTERKRTEEQIRSQLEELRRWQEVMLGREDRVQELKLEVNQLCRALGESPRYFSQEDGSLGPGATEP